MKRFKKKQLLPIAEESQNEPSEVLLRDVYSRGATFLPHAPITSRQFLFRRKFVMVFSLTVLALGGLALTGFYFFVRNPSIKFGEEMVNLTLEAPSHNASGAPFQVTAHYENRGAIALDKATLSIIPSAGFIADQPHEGTEWSFPLGSIGAHAVGERSVSGIILRQAGSEGTWRAVLTFTPMGYSAEFRKSSFATVSILPPVFTTTVDGPVNAFPGQPYSFTVRINNTAGRTLPHLGVMLTLPQTLTVQSSDPELVPAAGGHFLWPIESIPSGAPWEGTATVFVPTNFVLPSSLVIALGTTTASDFITLEEHNLSLGGVPSSGNIDLRINGISGASTMNFSDKFDAVVTIANPLDHAISNLTLQIEVQEHDFAFLDWQRIKSDVAVQPVSADQTDGRITHFVVSASRFPVFANVKTGGSAVFKIALPILSSEFLKSIPVGAMPRATTVATVTYLDGGKEATMVSNSVATTVNSNLTLARTARYVDDAHTRVRISLVMKNTMHELSALSFEVVLGSPLVRVDTQGVDAGEIHVDEKGRRVIWSLNRFPTTVQEIKGFIDLIVTPHPQEVGKAMVLIDSSSLSAQDNATGGTIHIAQGAFSL